MLTVALNAVTKDIRHCQIIISDVDNYVHVRIPSPAGAKRFNRAAHSLHSYREQIESGTIKIQCLLPFVVLRFPKK
ncbi:hypothetical protein D3C71_1802100 [compost metagenome]